MIQLNSNYYLKKYPTSRDSSILDNKILDVFRRSNIKKDDTLFDINEKVNISNLMLEFARLISFEKSLKIITAKVYYIPKGFVDFGYLLIDGSIEFSPLYFYLQLKNNEYYDIEEIDCDLNESGELIKIRNNPYDGDYYSSLPTIVWLTVRSIFLDNHKLGRYYKKEINEIYDNYYEDISRQEALSRAFAIEISSLKENKYLKKGKMNLSKKGKERSIELEEYYGESLGKRFKEYEEILKQGKY